MHTSVIIPVRHPAPVEMLSWVVEGFNHQRLAPGHTFEVIVGIDGGGGEATMKMDAGCKVTTHSLPRVGAAAVRNFLVREAMGDVLIFANSDTRPEAGMVQAHMDALAKLPAGSMVLGSAPWEMPAAPTVWDALLAETPMVFFYGGLVAGQAYDFRHAWTLNLSVRRADFLAAGGFCERIRPVYFEDIALGYRVMGGERKGVYFEPGAKVVHRHPTSLEQYLDREELLGLMSPVFARECVGGFAAIHGTGDVGELARKYREWVGMDVGMQRWIYERLKGWAGVPVASLGAERERVLMSVYQMHVPLKRLVFRLGFLRGVELVEDSRWEERKAVGLWRKVVE